MHVLAVNSVSTLLNYLTEQLENTPTLEEIKSFNPMPADDESINLEEADEQQKEAEDSQEKVKKIQTYH